MKPFIVLLISFGIALLITRATSSHFDIALSARIAMAIMMVFTSIAHFAFTKGMQMMMPGFIPFKKQLVLFTGFLEIAFGIGLLIPAYQVVTGWSLITFFILLLPMNINAAMQRVDYQKGTYEGSGLTYLWFRVPLQVFFIVWVYFAAIKG